MNQNTFQTYEKIQHFQYFREGHLRVLLLVLWDSWLMPAVRGKISGTEFLNFLRS